MAFAVSGFVFLLAGCGERSPTQQVAQNISEHAEDSHTDEEGVAFKSGQGLLITPDVIKALMLETAEADERPISEERSATAYIFATSPKILASALVPESQAAGYSNAIYRGAKLLRIDRVTDSATRMTELIFELDDSSSQTKPEPGNFVTFPVSSPPRTTLVVPRSAVLETATNKIVYVVNGNGYLRTVVQTGIRSADYIEITDGLYAGDIVVTSPVEQLWLSELRLTKGGGHSH